MGAVTQTMLDSSASKLQWDRPEQKSRHGAPTPLSRMTLCCTCCCNARPAAILQSLVSSSICLCQCTPQHQSRVHDSSVAGFSATSAHSTELVTTVQTLLQLTDQRLESRQLFALLYWSAIPIGQGGAWHFSNYLPAKVPPMHQQTTQDILRIGNKT